jgi:uncharacterized DUF497 family protein
VQGFRWNDWNTGHIGDHGVDPEEAEAVVRNAQRPFPRAVGDDKFLVWGRGRGGRYLQVIFVLDDDDRVFVIHARPLTAAEKRRLRRKL